MTLVRRFLDWWFQGLRNIFPTTLLKTTRLELVAIPDEEKPGDLMLWQSSDGAREPIGHLTGIDLARRRSLARQVRRGRLTTVLALPHRLLASRRTTLPSVAEKELRDVIGLDIDRLTPFSADEVFFTHRVLERLEDQDRIVVEVLYAPKATPGSALERLTSAGLPVTRLDGFDANGMLEGVNLLGPSDLGSWRWGTRLSAALMLGLILSVGGWIWAELGMMDRRIAELREMSVKERQLAFQAEDAFDGSVDGDHSVKAYLLRQDTPLAVEILTAVTEITPDHTWLDRLNLDQGRLEISGASQDATELIGGFEQNPMFDRPVFPTPLTRARGGDVERFFLSVDVPGLEVE